jgi:hypothetical protein
LFLQPNQAETGELKLIPAEPESQVILASARGEVKRNVLIVLIDFSYQPDGIDREL